MQQFSFFEVGYIGLPVAVVRVRVFGKLAPSVDIQSNLGVCFCVCARVGVRVCVSVCVCVCACVRACVRARMRSRVRLSLSRLCVCLLADLCFYSLSNGSCNCTGHHTVSPDFRILDSS